MSLRLAPYNNAMRLGQGFNSYSQQICIDDAVIIDPDRAENVITNDGITMRIVTQTAGKPSVWTRQKEVVVDNRAIADLLEIKAATAKHQALTDDGDIKEVEAEKPAHKLSASPTEKHADAGTDKNDSDSIEKIEHDEIEEAEETKGAAARLTAEEAADAERAIRNKEEKERLAEQAAYRKEIEKEVRDEERARRAEDRKEQQQIREEKRIYEAQRREDNRKAIANAADLKSLSLKDLDKIKAQNQFAERFVGMANDQDDAIFDPTVARGPSQTVIYSSRFVDRLSDVTDDMSVSGSLSIKAARIGGSGRGSFVDSDKFKESDLNFYISVKVVNQTLNFKDALVYNPLRSVDAVNFQEVYGDSFISGFLEGGEFNALVSMKILNKAKLTDIRAEAKVAFTAGPIDVTAEANVGIARSNIETNTETTIQVSWCGGGHIKPMEQQWDIKSLMAAASRFPDLVAECPQRTYAILTKYNSLRSFQGRKPAAYRPLQYEHAQIYTNALLDSFMSYKALYKRLGEQIFNVQGKTLEITSWEKKDASAGAVNGANAVVASASKLAASQQTALLKDPETGLYPHVEDLSRFEASVQGLSAARKAIRRQMVRIVNEVDIIEKDPKKATDEDRDEPFQSPVTFEKRLPDIVIPERLQPPNDPLTGKRIMAKPQSEEELKEQLRAEEEARKAAALYVADDDLSVDEKSAFDKLKTDHPGIGQHLRVSSAVGNQTKGVPFNNLEFLQEDWGVESVRVEIASGAVAYVEVSYDNGLLLRKGKRGNGYIKELNSFQPGERIENASIESGVPLGSKAGPCILAVRLYTNRGRRLLGQANKNLTIAPGRIIKDDVDYEQVMSVFVDSPLSKGTFKGFFGRCNEPTGPSDGIFRLGLIWGDISKSSPGANASGFASTAQAYDYSAEIDGPSAGIDRPSAGIDGPSAGTDRPSAGIDRPSAGIDRPSAGIDGPSAGIDGPSAGIDRPKKPVAYAQYGCAKSDAWANTPNKTQTIIQKFSPPYSKVPRVLSGLARIEQEREAPIRVGMSHQNITPDGFEMLGCTFNGGMAYGAWSSWLALPENDVHFETGQIDSRSYGRVNNEQDIRGRVNFANKFVGIPRVMTWLYELSFDNGWHSMATNALNLAEDSFEIDIKTWADRKFEGVRVGWLAFNGTGPTSRVEVGIIDISREARYQSATVTFPEPAFSKAPAVFLALTEFDAGDDKNLRLTGEVVDVTKNGFKYNCGTWSNPDDHNMGFSKWVWIAVE